MGGSILIVIDEIALYCRPPDVPLDVFCAEIMFFRLGKEAKASFRYSELSRKTSFLQEQNAGFSAQIHRVTMTKTFFFKGMLS